MVALVEGDSFCVESDCLLEVARLARRVAFSHLRDHHVNLVSHVFFLQNHPGNHCHQHYPQRLVEYGVNYLQFQIY